ncbi:MAG: dienelactone hydrolase family protein [Kofleriaceae bacterium]
MSAPLAIQRVDFPALPETFGPASGALVAPPGEERVPAVVLLQEYWGLNEHIQDLARRWAAEGFLVLAPDLYRGVLAEDATKAGELMSQLDRGRALADIAGAVAQLRAHPRCRGKVGVTGYCMGGAYALAAAARLPDLDAVIPFYGIPPQQDWSKITAPVQAHFAEHDGWAKPDAARAIQEAVRAGGGEMELFVYDAQHAFCNDTRPAVYAAEHAATAWQRSVAFFRKHLA